MVRHSVAVLRRCDGVQCPVSWVRGPDEICSGMLWSASRELVEAADVGVPVMSGHLALQLLEVSSCCDISVAVLTVVHSSACTFIFACATVPRLAGCTCYLCSCSYSCLCAGCRLLLQLGPSFQSPALSCIYSFCLFSLCQLPLLERRSTAG